MNDRRQETGVRSQESGGNLTGGNLANVRSPHRNRAFTLVEILVVVAIIAILAGLIVGLAGRASESKIRKRAEAEVQQLVMAIENYKSKLGYYPPDNPKDSTHTNTALYYELTGTRIPPALTNQLGVTDIANIGVRSENADPKPMVFLTGLKPTQYQEHVTDKVYRMTYAYGNVPWHYNPSSPTNNPGTFDLWVEITMGPKKIIVGNWKD